MKTKMLLLFMVLSLTGMAQTNWSIDKSHSNIRFTTKHMMISEVDGYFSEFDGSMTNSTEELNGSTIEFTAKVASINTGNDRRDDHLKSDDFFNAEAYPEIKFTGTLKKEGDQYFLVGDFTMRDVTKAVKFDVKFNGTIGKKAGFKITGVVDRFDYGLKWDRAMETGGLVVARDVKIVCNVQMNSM